MTITEESVTLKPEEKTTSACTKVSVEELARANKNAMTIVRERDDLLEVIGNLKLQLESAKAEIVSLKGQIR